MKYDRIVDSSLETFVMMVRAWRRKRKIRETEDLRVAYFRFWSGEMELDVLRRVAVRCVAKYGDYEGGGKESVEEE